MSPETCDLPLIRRYSRTAWRWVDAYNRGLDGILANYAVRKSKCHRFVTDAVDAEVNRLGEERRAAAEELPEALAEMQTAGAICDVDEDQHAQTLALSCCSRCLD